MINLKNLFLIFKFIIIFVSCNRNDEIKNNTINLVFDQSHKESIYKVLNYFSNAVSNKSNGSLKININSTREINRSLDDLISGKIDLLIAPPNKLLKLNNSFLVFDFPFIFNESDLTDILIKNKFKDFFKIENKNVRIVEFLGLGRLQVVTNIHDYKYKNLVEDYNSLKDPLNKSSSVREMTLSEIYDQKIKDHIILTNHSYLFQALITNSKSWEKLNELEKKAINEALKSTARFIQKNKVVKETSILNNSKDEYQIVRWPKTDLNRAQASLIEKYKSYKNKTPLFLKEVEKLKGKLHEGLMIGLDLCLRGSCKASGISITRGVELALDEINSEGGILGKKVKYIALDNGGFPSEGLRNVKNLNELPNLIAIMGGLHSPVALNQLDFIHKNKRILLIPWAAATAIVKNNYKPNYVFRYSIRDEYAGKILVNRALKESKNACLLLENTKWGDGNLKTIKNELSNKGLKARSITRFNWGIKNSDSIIRQSIKNGCEVFIFVGNAYEGGEIIKSIAKIKPSIPVISHWGITGANFFRDNLEALIKINFKFIQTFSFNKGRSKKKVQEFEKRYREKYRLSAEDNVIAPAGTIHAYELVKMLAQAIKNAGNTDADNIENQMKNLKHHNGLFKTSIYPFKMSNDALSEEDLSFCKYSRLGEIICE